MSKIECVTFTLLLLICGYFGAWVLVWMFYFANTYVPWPVFK